MGALPQEGFLMGFASIFTKTKSLCHLVVNPFNAHKTGFNKPAIKAFFEFLLLYPMILLIDKYYIAIKDICKKTKSFFFFTKGKVEFLPYPVDSEFFKPKNKAMCKKKLGLPAKQKIILYVGRIEYEKGSDIILKLAKLKGDILFLLCGQVLDENIRKNKTENLVSLGTKKKEDLVDYYNAADLCIFPSRSEAGPSAARESMCCGTQVLLPDIIGPRMLSPPALKTKLSVSEFNKKINEFFNNSKREKEALSKELRKFVIKNYSEKECKSLYVDKLLNN